MWRILESVPDPEIPVLSVVDLGIVRYVRHEVAARGELKWHVGITPTYSGCPATEVIRQNLRSALDGAGQGDTLLEEVLSPPWTSDWLTPTGRRKLQAFGIAPPEKALANPRHLLRARGAAFPSHEPKIACPRCGSRATQRVSEFGSTPCKAHYRCTQCLEPFDYFKCL